jgi:hypothetical protein
VWPKRVFVKNTILKDKKNLPEGKAWKLWQVSMMGAQPWLNNSN